MTMTAPRPPLRSDLALIAGWVPPSAKVIDIGCGDGSLLDYLVHEKNCDGRGMEISGAGVASCIAKGLSVLQGNADTDLGEFPAASCDFAILSQTLQATAQPAQVLEQLLRLAHRAIISVPNFAHWRARLNLLVQGRMPVTPSLPVEWYETQNIHLCTLKDIEALCAARGIKIYEAKYLSGGEIISASFANLRAEEAIFLLGKV